MTCETMEWACVYIGTNSAEIMVGIKACSRDTGGGLWRLLWVSKYSYNWHKCDICTHKYIFNIKNKHGRFSALFSVTNHLQGEGLVEINTDTTVVLPQHPEHTTCYSPPAFVLLRLALEQDRFESSQKYSYKDTAEAVCVKTCLALPPEIHIIFFSHKFKIQVINFSVYFSSSVHD